MQNQLKDFQLQSNNNQFNPDQQLSDQDGLGLAINPSDLGLNIATYKSFSFILFLVLNLCFSSFYFGYIIAYLGSFDLQTIITIYKIGSNTDTIWGLLQGIVAIGGGVGALTSSIVIKIFSRRNSIFFTNFLAIIFGILVMFPNLILFFICRFFQGLCIGLYSAIIPLLIKQYSPKQINGTLGALNQTFIAFGCFFPFAFQLILIQFNTQLEHWRISYGFPLITITLQTLFLIFIYKKQTPAYYLSNNQTELCTQYLKQLYKPEYISIVLSEKQNDIQDPTSSNKLTNKSIVVEDHPLNPSIVSDKGRRIRIILAIHIAILQQFVGINSVVAYGVQIMSSIVPQLSKVIPAILNLEQVIAALISTALLARFGRKIILQCGCIVSTISISFVAIGFIVKSSNDSAGNILIIMGLIIFMANFGLSLGPITWLYIAQIVEPQILPFSTLANWAGASIVIITFPILSKIFGSPIPLFFFFAAWSATSFIFNAKYMIETKNKTDRQIRQEFQNL